MSDFNTAQLSAPQLNVRRSRFPGPVLHFGIVATVNLALVIVMVTGLVDDPTALALVGSVAVYFAITAVALRGLILHYPHDALGLCNVVTHLRGALASVMVAPVMMPGLLIDEPVLAWTVLGIGALALSLDGVDGWFARRSGLASDFGARFDMEVDSILALILAILALQSGKAGEWMLLLGTMRYLFVLATWALPWMRRRLPVRFAGKVVCVIQLAVLITLVAPVVAAPVSTLLAGFAVVLLIWSFSMDVIWLYRRRAF